MKQGKDDSPVRGGEQNIDIVSATQEFNGFNSKDLSKVLKDSDNFSLNWKTQNGSFQQIDMEKLASCLPLNLTAVFLSPDRVKHMSYVLSGIRLLHTLADVATRNSKLEQVLLDDVKLLEQVMDLVFYTLLVLSHRHQGNHLGASPIQRLTVLPCCLHLLITYLSSQWNELVLALLAHPKAEIFVESAFNSLRENIRILRFKLSKLANEVSNDDSTLPAATRTAHFMSQQCEASLQFLLFLCQQKPFRDRVLRNKELCKNGGILSLARAILRLTIPNCFKESSETVASICRLKAKVLSILLQLCEAESISYLDEVAGSPKSMQLGQSVALEFLGVLKTAFRREGREPGDSSEKKNIPRGFLLINSLRLVDIFSDDSNFRFSFMTSTVPFMTEILTTPHEEFVSSWCTVSSAITEEDANIEYDAFNAAGIASISVTSIPTTEANYACPFSPHSMPAITYSKLRTSCMVKIIANLHIFVPNICEEHERDLFVREFHKYILRETPKSDKSKAVVVCKNLSSLADYAKSLIPTLLNEDDVQLLRVFTDTLRGLFHLEDGDHSMQVVKDGFASDGKAESVNRAGSKDTQPEISDQGGAIADSSISHGEMRETDKMDLDPIPINNNKEGELNEDERGEAVYYEQRKKRKRNIMNDSQIRIIERALVEEPEMQRNAAALQSWSDKLSSEGPEVTPSQLKNWINNRKARLARVAKELRVPAEGETPESPSEDKSNPSETTNTPVEPGSTSSIVDREVKDRVFQTEVQS